MGLYDLTNRTRAFGESRRLNVGTDKRPVMITNVHEGDDYAESYGNDPSYAIQNGVVVFSGWSNKYGWHARYRLDAAPDVIIGHHSLDARSPLKVGDKVVAGKTFVGRGGESASGADGNHVHIQAERNGTPVSPRPFIVAGLASFGASPISNPPISNRKEAPEMRVIKVVQPSGTTYALVGTRYFQRTNDVAQANRWAEVWGDAVTVSDSAFDEALARAVDVAPIKAVL